MSNPLSKFFRQPALYVSLPSKGEYWPEGSIELDENGQIAVYPMTARDELTIKTPDALMNGQSVVDVMKSCCPQIKDPWKMPAVDTDFLLIAIRIASYGENMEFTASCPKCKEESPFELHLPSVIDQVRCPDYHTPLQLNGMDVYLKPQTYKQTNDAGQRMYQEQRMMATINSSTLSEDEKLKQFKEIFKDVSNINLASVATNVKSVVVDGEEVVDTRYINEFLDNAPKKIWDQVQKYITDINQQGRLPDNQVTCDDCKHEYKVPIEFDYATFFV